MSNKEKKLIKLPRIYFYKKHLRRNAHGSGPPNLETVSPAGPQRRFHWHTLYPQSMCQRHL